MCASPSRLAAEQALVEGASLRQIGKRFALSAAALCRHNRGHLPPALARAKDATDAARVHTILDDLHELEERARILGAAARRAGDLRAALLGVREQTRLLELKCRVAEAELRVQTSADATPVFHVTEQLLERALEAAVTRRPEIAKRALERLGFIVEAGTASAIEVRPAPAQLTGRDLGPPPSMQEPPTTVRTKIATARRTDDSWVPSR